jgi:hypothetical protein
VVLWRNHLQRVYKYYVCFVNRNYTWPRSPHTTRPYAEQYYKSIVVNVFSRDCLTDLSALYYNNNINHHLLLLVFVNWYIYIYIYVIVSASILVNHLCLCWCVLGVFGRGIFHLCFVFCIHLFIYLRFFGDTFYSFQISYLCKF